ncbi:MAG: hypothetical protein AVDCRST_MAG62-72, partial [uncultured Sphingomonas sp.]
WPQAASSGSGRWTSWLSQPRPASSSRSTVRST